MLTEEETEEEMSTSVVQLGAPPPLPPATTPTTTAATCEDEVEYDEDGFMWAAACQSPEDTPDTIELEVISEVQVGFHSGNGV